MRDQKELHPAYIKKPHREHGPPSTMPVEPLHRVNRGYSQTEKESLGQSWGMNIHRYYLLGIPFDSYTDHQPQIHIYNSNKKGNARIERHRLKVQDFQYTVKYCTCPARPIHMTINPATHFLYASIQPRR